MLQGENRLCWAVEVGTIDELWHAGSMSWSAMISGIQCTTGKLAPPVANGGLIPTTSSSNFFARTDEGQGMHGIADRDC